LSLPHGGLRTDVIRTKVFEEYVRDNADSWYTWAQNHKLGVERMEDLILVTGCTLVTSWAAAVFDNHTTPEDATSISLHAQKFESGGAEFFWRNRHGNIDYHNSHFNSLAVRSPGYISRRKLNFLTRMINNTYPGINASSFGSVEQNTLSSRPNISGP
jgi:hypothetical protein